VSPELVGKKKVNEHRIRPLLPNLGFGPFVPPGEPSLLDDLRCGQGQSVSGNVPVMVNRRPRKRFLPIRTGAPAGVAPIKAPFFNDLVMCLVAPSYSGDGACTHVDASTDVRRRQGSEMVGLGAASHSVFLSPQSCPVRASQISLGEHARRAKLRSGGDGDDHEQPAG